MNSENDHNNDLQQKYYEDIISMLPGHVYWKDKNGVFLGCNNLQAIDAGFNSPKEIVGKTDFDMPWAMQADYLQENDRKIMNSQKPISLEELFELPDGTRRIYLSKKIPLFDDNAEVSGILGISIDITDQKEIEKALKLAKEQAELSDQLKSTFIENMEHDIRTPMSGIFGLSDILESKETDPEKKQFLSMISKSAKELLAYCNNLLDFSKLEAGPRPITEQAFDLSKLVESIISMEMPIATHNNIKLSYSFSDNVPYVILSDEFRLNRILLNLVGNAIKFTPSGSVDVHIDRIDSLPGREFVLVLSISDTGIGISDDKQTLIFQKYVKVSPSNRGLYKGQGLGLSMVKKFVDDLDGEVQLKSELGKGATFNVLVPVKESLSNNIK